MYEIKTFSIPSMEGISEQTITEHLGLYAGYVTHVNHIHDQLAHITDGYAKAEMQRRLGFEFGGMRNHEYYFTQFEGGPTALPEGKFKDMIQEQFGSLETYIEHVRGIAMTRGVGWSMTYVDRQTNRLICAWVDEQQFGQLADLDIILALDMWEHSYMLDYPPSEKKKYIDAFFKNVNWEVVAQRI